MNRLSYLVSRKEEKYYLDFRAMLSFRKTFSRNSILPRKSWRSTCRCRRSSSASTCSGRRRRRRRRRSQRPGPQPSEVFFSHTQYQCLPQMALQDFIFSSLFYLSRNKSPFGWGLFSYSQREREEERRMIKARRIHYAMGRDLWNHNLCLQRWASYPFRHIVQSFATLIRTVEQGTHL